MMKRILTIPAMIQHRSYSMTSVIMMLAAAAALPLIKNPVVRLKPNLSYYEHDKGIENH